MIVLLQLENGKVAILLLEISSYIYLPSSPTLKPVVSKEHENNDSLF